MIFVVTSVWIDYLRKGDVSLVTMLETNLVLIHSFVIGEIACSKREELLAYLHELPQITVATDREVLHFIRQNDLMARGVGYLDMHLLASVQLHGNTSLWTHGKKLAVISRELQFAH